MTVRRLSKSKRWEKIRSYGFLFEQLTKRDFAKKYKRSILGIFWSVLSPVLTMLVMRLMFTEFFGRDIPHYTTYILAGNIVFSYFRESTMEGMNSIVENARVLSKINIPKILFLLSKSVAILLNFTISLLVFFVFCAIDGITFRFTFFALLYPVICLYFFCTGMALLLSTLYVFMKDIKYLWNIFLRLLMYMSAVFYRIDSYSASMQQMFLLNPVYVYISYFRTVTIDGVMPSLTVHALALGYAVVALIIGMIVFKRKQDLFIFYF